MKKIAFPLLSIAVLLCVPLSFGACHAVGASATGNGSGSDWNNRMNKLPATLVRGDTYYLADSADGAYGNYTFNTSGSTLTTIKKSQSYDYGRTSDGCTNDISAGWNASTMGSGQASFLGMSFSPGAPGSNFLVTGNGTFAHQGCGGGPSGIDKTSGPVTRSDCGIQITSYKHCTSMSENGCGSPVNFGVAYGAAVTGVKLRYMEWFGTWTLADLTAPEESFSWSWGPSVANSYILDHIYGHNSGCGYTHQDGPGSRTISFSYIWAINSDAAHCHGEATYDTNGVTVIDHDNVYRDIVGSANHWFDGGSYPSAAFYNNVYWDSSPVPSWVSSNGYGWGLISCANGARCGNFVFYNNTIVNITGGYFNGLRNTTDSSCTSCVARNNLWYGGGAPLSFLGWTHDHESSLNISTSDVTGGTGDVRVTSGALNPFVNWQGGDFHLTSENAYWTGGLAQASPYNTDPDGLTRGADGTWERGAFEFSSTKSGSGPGAPTGVIAIVH